MLKRLALLVLFLAGTMIFFTACSSDSTTETPTQPVANTISCSIITPIDSSVLQPNSTVYCQFKIKAKNELVTSIQFFMDSMAVGLIEGQTTLIDTLKEFSWSIPAYVSGNHKIWAIARDKNGVEGKSAVLNISVSDTTSGTTTTPIPNEQQATVANQTAEQVSGSIAQLDVNINMMSSGTGFPSKKSKNPPLHWSAIGDGWYQYNYYYGGVIDSNTVWKIRYTPNVWATTIPDYSTVTKFEYNFNNSWQEVEDGVTSNLGYIWNTVCEYDNPNRLTVKGNNDFNVIYNVTSTSYNFDMSFYWNMAYNGVSVNSQDKAAHFTMQSLWPYSTDQSSGQVLFSDLNSEFKFNSAGVGVLDPAEQYLAGKCWTNGNLFIKFYYNGTNGWYTIAAQNFATQSIWNPWNSKKVKRSGKYFTRLKK